MIVPQLILVNNLSCKEFARAYFKQDLQLHKAWQSVLKSSRSPEFLHFLVHMFPSSIAHFDFTSAQLVINSTLIIHTNNTFSEVHLRVNSYAAQLLTYNRTSRSLICSQEISNFVLYNEKFLRYNTATREHRNKHLHVSWHLH